MSLVAGSKLGPHEIVSALGTRTLIKRYQPHDPVGVVYATWVGSMTPDGKMFAFGPRNELNDLYIADKQKHWAGVPNVAQARLR